MHGLGGRADMEAAKNMIAEEMLEMELGDGADEATAGGYPYHEFVQAWTDTIDEFQFVPSQRRSRFCILLRFLFLYFLACLWVGVWRH